MTNKQLAPKVRAWLKGTDVEPEDARRSVGSVSVGAEHTRQRGRWWPLPSFRREAAPQAARTDAQPRPIPATNGHTPTVIGRTTSMLSPAKTIVAAALVFGIGGVMLIAQPFQPQSTVPGADTKAGVAENVPFTMSFSWRYPSVRPYEERTEDGVTKSIGECWAPGILAPSDPRMAGTLEYCGSEHVYGTDREADTVVLTETYRITNEEGAWQGSSYGAWWDDPGSGDRMEVGGDPLILVGEGAYDGLYAALTFLPDWRDIRGVIFAGAPPAAVEPPSAG
jgi:hypothetical protein